MIFVFILISLVCIHQELIQEYIQKSWSDYYSNIAQPTGKNFYSNDLFSSGGPAISPTAGNAYVFNCYFHDMTATNGTAILFSLAGSYLLVEKCTIYNCKVTVYTAGIRVPAGNCIVAFVCGQYGYSDHNDGFCSICDDPTRTINSIFDSSISHCEAKNWYIMFHAYGHVYYKSVNLSHNKADYGSAFRFEPNKINEKTKHGSDVLYCSFSNNTSTTQFCVIVSNQHDTSSRHEFKNCNIIKNRAINTITSRGKLDIISSCILNNGDSCFYTESSESIITLYSCSVDNTKQSGSGFVTSHGSTNSFIHGLTFISTGVCKASFDVIGTLIPTPYPEIIGSVPFTLYKNKDGNLII